MCRSVDLPEPDSPAIAHHSPRATASVTSARRGDPAPNPFASPRTSSMRGRRSEPGGDAEPGSEQSAECGAGEEPALLREDGDRGEGDRDLQERHGNREEMVRVERLLALLVPAAVGLFMLLRIGLDLLLLGGVAFRFVAIELGRLRVGDARGGNLGHVLLEALRLVEIPLVARLGALEDSVVLVEEGVVLRVPAEEAHDRTHRREDGAEDRDLLPEPSEVAACSTAWSCAP